MQSAGKKEYLAWRMWGIMIVTYMFNTFHAVAMGGIRQDVMHEMSLDEGQFVMLTNAFSYAYMLMQIPAGILLDRLGARMVAVLGNGIAAIGVLLFALGQTYGVLFVGRGMIGLGCSVCYLSVLKICAAWFSEKLFCTMSGVTTFVGMLGAMLAQTPMALLADRISWRMLFVMLAVVTLAVVCCIWFLVKDAPPEDASEIAGGEKRCETIRSLLKAVGWVLKNPYTWPPLIAYGCFYGTYLLLGGMYGTSMISSFYRCSPVQASGCITAAVFGCAVGSVVVGLLSDRLRNRRMTQVICGLCFVASWLVLWAAVGKISLLLLYGILFILGFCSCAYAVCWSCVKECNHPDFVGISTSIANMGGYLGTIVVPTLLGGIFEQTLHMAGEQAAYGRILSGAVIISSIGVLAAVFVKETKGENIYGRR